MKKKESLHQDIKRKGFDNKNKGIWSVFYKIFFEHPTSPPALIELTYWVGFTRNFYNKIKNNSE